jgi:hypothetical protein
MRVLLELSIVAKDMCRRATHRMFIYNLVDYKNAKEIRLYAVYS